MRRPTRRQIARSWLDADEQQFRASGGKAVWAWEAIATCLSARLPLPEWTRVYLFDVARDITTLSRRKIPPKGGIDRAVASALRLKGAPSYNPFHTLARIEHEAMIPVEVYTYWGQHQSYKWDAIFQDVAVAHSCDYCKGRVSKGTVRALWYKHALDIIPGHLVKRARSKKLADILR